MTAEGIDVETAKKCGYLAHGYRRRLRAPSAR
jgi:hypothetical protein